MSLPVSPPSRHYRNCSCPDLHCNGSGAYWYWNGDSYEGDFQQNKKSGIGLATYKEQPPEDRDGNKAHLLLRVEWRFYAFVAHGFLWSLCVPCYV